MTDYISRQDAINALENTDCELLSEEWDMLTDSIMCVPAAPVREVKRGEKIVCGSDEGIAYYVCPECQSSIDYWYNFCPYCGTDVSI